MFCTMLWINTVYNFKPCKQCSPQGRANERNDKNVRQY